MRSQGWAFVWKHRCPHQKSRRPRTLCGVSQWEGCSALWEEGSCQELPLQVSRHRRPACRTVRNDACWVSPQAAAVCYGSLSPPSHAQTPREESREAGAEGTSPAHTWGLDSLPSGL